MSLIPARLHGVLDYGVVVLLLLAPALLFPMRLVGSVVTLCYALAAVHLTMTLLTDFPLGMVEVVPLGAHGVIELVASIALIVAPWMAQSFFGSAKWLFTIFGVLLFVVWMFTDYSGPRASSKTSPPARHHGTGKQAAKVGGTRAKENEPHKPEPARDENARPDEKPDQGAPSRKGPSHANGGNDETSTRREAAPGDEERPAQNS